ncbi:MAG: sulfatase-like hydrolase/transferase [Burkholderiaceae bacterium]
MKNLVILHLESISRQCLASFASSFPNTRRLLDESLVFDHFHSSATSTRMVITYLLYGNDFEYDTAMRYEGMRAAGNNRDLLTLLQGRGYRAEVLCLNGFHGIRTPLETLAKELPSLWGTNEFSKLFERFDELTDAAPFAVYVWNLLTHIEHSRSLAPLSDSLTDQVQRACKIADDAIGVMLATLQRKGLLENTTIVVFGDHGDDYWTHGFKAGMIHGTEPYAGITWVPMAIRDPALQAGHTERLASTIDIAPTCLALLGIDETPAFAHSGIDLLSGERALAFSQNFTANQGDSAALGIRQAFAVCDRTHTLLASSRGLELYAHRLDPGNHCNLLHFFELDPGGSLVFRKPQGVAPHFLAAMQDNPHSIDGLLRAFQRLRTALAERLQAKRDYIVGRGVAAGGALDPACLRTLNRDGREAFFRRVEPAAASSPRVSFRPR